MGTRSIANIHQKGKDSPIICQIYRQMDGYPEGMGSDLKEICQKITIVNGIKVGQTGDGFANGMECLAATIVKKLKVGIGGIYLVPPSEEKEEYNYDIYADKGKVKIHCTDSSGKKHKIP